MLQDRGSLLTGLGLGAGLMYLLDPDRGRRRRALVKDRMSHAAHVASDAAGATGRDLAHRTAGVGARLRGAVARDEVDDEVLVERVRACLGRKVSHPHAIEVSASDGVVTLRGPVLRSEVPGLLRSVSRVKGVRRVESQLQEHESPGNVPALQGGPRPSTGRHLWSPAARFLAGTAGVAMTGYGVSRRSPAGWFLAATGAALTVRAATNLEFSRMTGVGADRSAVDVQKTITIDAPAADVFAFWSDYANFPKFLSRVIDVGASSREGRSHWTVAGPAGTTVEFDAEVSALVPNEVLGWRSLEGSIVGHSGLVRFEEAGEGRTRVQVHMTYNPPGGWLGHGVAAAFGVDPKRSLDEDLVRMKTLLETGRVARDAAKRETT